MWVTGTAVAVERMPYGIILCMDFESASELVELGECDSEQELVVVRALLESEGIECFGPILTSAYFGRLGPQGTAPLKLNVRKEDLAAARAILDAPLENPLEASDDEDS